MEKKQNWALITGASAGIGKAFAKKLALRGYSLYLVARRMEKLEELAKELKEKHSVEVEPIQADLTSQEDRDRVFEKTQGTPVSLFVNNAGMGWVEAFAEEKRDSLLAMIHLNVVAVTDLAHRFIQPMVQRGEGAMIIVASTASFYPIPYFSAYSATKAFDYFLGQGLYMELKSSGVHVLTLCPGPTITEFGGDELNIQDHSGFLAMTAESVVEKALRGLKKKKPVVIPGFFNRMAIFMQGWTPRGWIQAINHWIFRKVYLKVKKG